MSIAVAASRVDVPLAGRSWPGARNRLGEVGGGVGEAQSVIDLALAHLLGADQAGHDREARSGAVTAEGRGQAAGARGVQDRPVRVVVEQACARCRERRSGHRGLPEAQLGVGAEVGVAGVEDHHRGVGAAARHRAGRDAEARGLAAHADGVEGVRGLGDVDRRHVARGGHHHLRDGRVGVELPHDRAAAGIAGNAGRDGLVEREAEGS